MSHLVETLCAQYSDEGAAIQKEIEIDDAVDLEPDVAAPLGLILNEFVTNSVVGPKLSDVLP